MSRGSNRSLRLDGRKDKKSTVVADRNVFVQRIHSSGGHFAIHKGIDLLWLEMISGGHWTLLKCGSRSARSALRARKMRDMTVPMGTSRMRAISWYLSS